MTGAPLLNRIKIATFSAPDVDQVSAVYEKWFGYGTVETGEISPEIATSWGSAMMAGRRYVLMQPANKLPVYIRAVEIDAVPNYRPLTTWGWNAIEVLVEDPFKLNRDLSDSPFIIIGKPKTLPRFPTICAMQVRGIANEVLYLTCDTAPEDKAFLPRAGTTVGRPFVMVVAGPSAESIIDWYATHFGIDNGSPVSATAVELLQQAQALPDVHKFPVQLKAIKEKGYFIEIDGFPNGTGPKPQYSGQLPPGISMTSFAVDSLDKLTSRLFAEPISVKCKGYDGRRSATTVGAAGELVELIEG